jgi:hypothetical protein
MALDMPSRGVAWGGADAGAPAALLRLLAVAGAIGWAVAFVVIGLQYQLQMYGDGSLFSYAVGVQEAWAYHWHNISGRLAVFALTGLPAQAVVALTGSARGGIALYGLLFFAAPLAGLGVTWVADRSPGRVIFALACLSTALLCPLVFGFPTEMWLAHALFWPTLGLCHYARGRVIGPAVVFAALLALCFTHEGALILASVIVAGLSLRGWRDARFIRTAICLVLVLAIWAAVKMGLPPDAYDAPVMASAAQHFFDLSLLRIPVLLLLCSALAAYGLIFTQLRRLAAARAPLYAFVAVACGLCAYWLWFDHALLAEDRYFLRTVVLIGAAGLGALAGAAAVEADGLLRMPDALRARIAAIDIGGVASRTALGAILLIMAVHAVETGKFVHEWQAYKAAVRSLAMGETADPALGDPRFVSAARIDPALNRLSWSSTTPYLSVLLAPRLIPKRLVIDPDEGYFWLACATATATEKAARAVPVESRALLRGLACLHR